MGQLIAYVRVSTIEQNEQRQVKAIEEKYKIDKWYIEKVSGKDTNRQEFKDMMNYVRSGDTVIVLDFSRLSRSTKDLLNTVEQLESKGVELISIKENVDTSTATGRLMLTMISALVEFERSNLRERQQEGIELAKERGVYMGRQKIQPKNFDELYKQYLNREIETKTELAERLNISRPTLNRIIKDLENN